MYLHVRILTIPLLVRYKLVEVVRRFYHALPVSSSHCSPITPCTYLAQVTCNHKWIIKGLLLNYFFGLSDLSKKKYCVYTNII
jgi:hypothetical protein